MENVILVLKTNWFWIFVLGAVLLICAAALFLQRRAPASYAHIYMDGVLVESVSLTAVPSPYSFSLESSGGYNTVSVEEGRIRISDADCPDGSCVRQGWLGGAIPIVCLPHRVVIKPDGGAPADIDAIVG